MATNKVDLSKLAPGLHWALCGAEILSMRVESEGDRTWITLSNTHGKYLDSFNADCWDTTIPHPTRVWPVEFPKEPPALRVRDLAVGSVFRFNNEKHTTWVRLSLNRLTTLGGGFTTTVDEYKSDHWWVSELLFDGATIASKGGE